MNRPMNPRLKTILYPSFLEGIDRYTLENHPRLWPTKFWYIFYWSLLIAIPILLISSIFAIVAPFQNWLTNFGQFANRFWVLIVFVLSLSVASALGWFYNFRQYHPEKEFAPFSIDEEYFSLVIYLACLLLFVFPSYLATVAVQWRLIQLAENIDLKHDLSYMTTVSETFIATSSNNSSNLNSSPSQRQNLDLGVFRKYTLKPIDIHNEPFDWSLFKVAAIDAKANAESLRTLAFGSNIWFLAIAFAFINAGLIVYLFHYFWTIDYLGSSIVEETLGPLIFAFVICLVFLVPPIRGLMTQPYYYMMLAALLVWISTGFILYFLFIMPDNSDLKNDESMLIIAIMVLPIFVFYSVALAFILINPNPDHLGGYLLVATLSYVPMIPYIKRRLLSIYASPRRLQ